MKYCLPARSWPGLLATVALTSGCVTTRPPAIHDLPHQQPGRVRIALHNGKEVIAAQTVLTRDSVVGQRVGRGSPEVRFARSEVREIHVYEVNYAATLLSAVALGSLAVAAYFYSTLSKSDF